MKDYISKNERLNNLKPKAKRDWVAGLTFIGVMLLLAVDIACIVLGGA